MVDVRVSTVLPGFEVRDRRTPSCATDQTPDRHAVHMPERADSQAFTRSLQLGVRVLLRHFAQ